MTESLEQLVHADLGELLALFDASRVVENLSPCRRRPQTDTVIIGEPKAW